MRKSTKIAVVLAAAALLVAGFAFTTLAKGWVKEAEGLYYYEDAEGMKVYNEWKKDTDPNTGVVNYYYLGDDGYMVTNTLVETDGYKYWCGADGAKVVNAWIQVPADEDEQDSLSVDYRWYRFNKNGQAVKGMQTIDGKKYFFDGDCKMVYGYVNYNADKKAVEGWTTKVEDAYGDADYQYFCQSNDEGWAVTSEWRNETIDNSTDTYEKSSNFWAFYQSSGKRALKNSTGYLWNGVRYYFDATGHMLNGWYLEATRSDNDPLDPTASHSVAEYYGGEDDGKKVKKAWQYLKTKDSDNDNSYWFWFDNTGAAIQESGVYKIDGKFYAFAAPVSDDGISASRMLSGLVKVTGIVDYITDPTVTAEAVKVTTLAKWLEDAKEDVYFFSGDEKNDGSLKKNVTFNKEFDDDTYQLAVDAEGKLCNFYNTKAKKYYRNGYLLKASEESRYELVKVWTKEYNETTKEYDYDEKLALLSTSGSEVTSGTVSDADGTYYLVNKTDGNIYVADSSLPSASKAVSAFKKNYKKNEEAKIEGTTYYVWVNPTAQSNIFELGLKTWKQPE